jgi:hypothetical protein
MASQLTALNFFDVLKKGRFQDKSQTVAYPGIQLRTKGRENVDLGAVAP